ANLYSFRPNPESTWPCSTLRLSGVTGSPDIKNNLAQELLVYPNPTAGSFTLQRSSTEPCSIYICDIMGNIILQRNHVIEKALDLSLNEEAPGVYLIKIETAGKLETKKIIKQ
ncbi:MAG TPA: T9SS type A sorting domain-containing protein, partial [Bacteroidia bacterium]|nr:T9SS type A sorting domain-containing protein [Bacteroidia bacterium]